MLATQAAKPSPCPLPWEGRGESVPLATHRRAAPSPESSPREESVRLADFRDSAASLPPPEQKASSPAASFRALMAERPGLRRL